MPQIIDPRSKFRTPPFWQGEKPPELEDPGVSMPPSLTAPPTPQPRPEAPPELTALDRLKSLQMPEQPKKPGFWRNLAGAAVGAAAGYVNSDPRSRPIDADPLIDEIKAPGYAARMRDYGIQRQGLEQQADIESEIENRRMKREQTDAAIASHRATEAARKAQEARANTPATPKPESPPSTYEALLVRQAQDPDPAVSEPAKTKLDELKMRPETVGRETPEQAFARRKGEAATLGLKEGTLAYQSYVGTGRIPAPPSAPPSATASLGFSPAGLDLAAHQYATTGQMPPLGMGSSGARASIINRAAELYPNLDIGGSRAGFDADRSSKVSLQKQLDAVNAFEQTALRNLDLFGDQAKRIIDTGSPFINRPVREITRKMVGDKEFLAFEAARRVAVNEIARVTSNPNLVGVLSDSARKEVESFIPENATLAEIYAVSNILKQDMRNRIQSMRDQMQEIDGRISGRRGSGQPNGAPPPLNSPGQPQTVKMKLPNGKIMSGPAANAAELENLGAKRVN